MRGISRLCTDLHMKASCSTQVVSLLQFTHTPCCVSSDATKYGQAIYQKQTKKWFVPFMWSLGPPRESAHVQTLPVHRSQTSVGVCGWTVRSPLATSPQILGSSLFPLFNGQRSWLTPHTPPWQRSEFRQPQFLCSVCGYVQ